MEVLRAAAHELPVGLRALAAVLALAHPRRGSRPLDGCVACPLAGARMCHTGGGVRTEATVATGYRHAQVRAPVVVTGVSQRRVVPEKQQFLKINNNFQLKNSFIYIIYLNS